jgi:glutamyl-tRNA reductase
MSGQALSKALRHRFETIRQAELQRLEKKLRGLSAEDRFHLEAITASVIQAIAGVPDRALAGEVGQHHVDRVAELFALKS